MLEKSVFDIYIEFMQIIFGVDMPPALAYICFTLFLTFIIGVIFWIFRLIFRGFC
ncbi:putative transmembrane protein [Spiroplasma phage SVGII3]|uniref:Transmembrane protein n=2 Tax=root TaxID=1 RepID=Q3ZVF1_9VIRU|nr:putative transmembrane protein [Spiroplasma phage SVGII3]CAI94592.1 putative transmembrane protein [Spiroplasma phage SVGII3]CAK99946.1 probable plectrovirus svts2 orf 13 transmembrane protein [Spiroplasma citri]